LQRLVNNLNQSSLQTANSHKNYKKLQALEAQSLRTPEAV